MDKDLTQALRFKLQKRYRRLCAVDVSIFQTTLVHFWKFIQSHSILADLVEDLRKRHPNLAEEFKVQVLDRNGETRLYAADEEETSALGLVAIEHCLHTGNDYESATLGMIYGYSSDTATSVNGFIELFVEPFYEYLDEQIDDQRTILSTLKKFKRRSEWFKKEQLFRLHQGNTKNGENNLNFALYEFLFDQGIEFHLEPKSIEGKIDLIESQSSDEKIMVEGKIFDSESRNKAYICKGFNQLYIYLCTYNQPFGYLVVFNISDKQLNFSVESDSAFFPYVSFGNKIIYLIVIDLYEHETSASKRGILTPITITKEDLVSQTETL